MCKKYAATQKDAQCEYTTADKLDLPQLIDKLVTASSSIVDEWRSERNHQEFIDKLCKELTKSFKEEKILKEYPEKIHHFHKYLLA